MLIKTSHTCLLLALCLHLKFSRTDLSAVEARRTPSLLRVMGAPHSLPVKSLIEQESTSRPLTLRGGGRESEVLTDADSISKAILWQKTHRRTTPESSATYESTVFVDPVIGDDEEVNHQFQVPFALALRRSMSGLT
eukprot:2591443-Rhodomonas_salina.3